MSIHQAASLRPVKFGTPSRPVTQTCQATALRPVRISRAVSFKYTQGARNYIHRARTLGKPVRFGLARASLVLRQYGAASLRTVRFGTPLAIPDQVGLASSLRPVRFGTPEAQQAFICQASALRPVRFGTPTAVQSGGPLIFDTFNRAAGSVEGTMPDAGGVAWSHPSWAGSFQPWRLTGAGSIVNEDGSGNRAQCESRIQKYTTVDTYTMALKVNMQPSTASSTSFSAYMYDANSDNAVGIFFRISSAGAITAYLDAWTPSDGNSSAESAVGMTANTDHDVELRVTATGCELWVDGVQKKTMAYGFSLPTIGMGPDLWCQSWSRVYVRELTVTE